MNNRDTAYIIKYWYDALVESARQGADGFTEFAGQDPLCLAKLKILWRVHAGTYLQVHMSDGEKYIEWAKHGEWSSQILDPAMEDAMSGEWTEEEAEELKKFHAECIKGAYEVSEVRELLHAVFHDADKETWQKIDEEIRRRKDFVRWTLYDFENARKEELEAPYRKESDEPPPGMDEFEYIDWVISH